EMESCEPQLETARDNGIPVLILDTGVESSMVTAVCQTDNVAAGQAAGEKLCEKLEGHGRIALVSHLPDTETCILRTEGFRKALEQYPDIDLVCVMEQDPLLTATDQIADMKENHPNLDGIFATNENLTDAVLTVYKDEEVLPVLVGFDNGEEQIRAIKEGREYGCISQNPYSMGYAVVIAALRAAAGEEIDEKIDSGYVWIDQTNIEDPANQIYLYQ
ncbi:MAG: substrate-binding domain-containing protein, partial [Lachnospiraceae bacterium]|nr:substrate-binding domain-containing protein [Lachnospiraceae bacterium]